MFARTFESLVPHEDCSSCRGVVHVGAPPFKVEHGLPGATAEVRAYAARIQYAWATFINTDVSPWVIEKDKGAVEDTPEGPVTTPGGLTDDDRAIVKQVYEDYSKFDAYHASLEAQSDSILGLGTNASEVWQGLELHETLLKADRVSFEKHIGTKLKSADPGPLEKPGGVEQESPFGFSKIPWTPVLIVAGIAATGYALSKAGAFLPSRSVSELHHASDGA